VGIVGVSLLVLAGLLVLPGIAAWRRGLGWAGIYGVVLSAFTCWVYAHDKRQAQAGEWRVSEAQLHLLELLGGWPGAWLAQRRFRHKCAKAGYQVVFWLIVLGWQFAAFDSLWDWQHSRMALKWMEQSSARQR
jgi:uncharacterized membrane protein YsdA (DUF1294 family)